MDAINPDTFEIEDLELREKITEAKIYKGKILFVEFVTLQDYLFMLEEMAKIFKENFEKFENCPKPILYLCAAVSDFYIPFEEISEHKIQSRAQEDGMAMKLKKSPKILKNIREISQNFVMVSFKLETDPEILEDKVMKSFKEYQSDWIVGNLLQTKDTEITLYKKNEGKNLLLKTEGIDLEEIVVKAILC